MLAEPAGRTVGGVTTWQFERHLARIARVVDDVVAEHATSYWGRPARRHDDPPVSSTWTIEGEVVVEFRFDAGGHDQLLVHDVSLVAPLRKRLRTRHLVVEHA